MPKLKYIFCPLILLVLSTNLIIGQSNFKYEQHGTGFAISKNGYILTNYHVIYLNNRNSVGDLFRVYQIINGEAIGYNAKVVSTDYVNDLAILKIDDSTFKGMPVIPYKIITRTIEKGTDIFTLGFPRYDIQGLETKVTKGIIIAQSGFSGEVGHYTISAAIDHGSSGGPLFDSDGNIIGITDRGVSTEDSKLLKNAPAISTSQFYAIKASRILPMLDGLPIIELSEKNTISELAFPKKVSQLEKFVFLIATYSGSVANNSNNKQTKSSATNSGQANAIQPLFEIGQGVYFKDRNKIRKGVITKIEVGVLGYWYIVEFEKSNGKKDKINLLGHRLSLDEPK